jgi:hypothetical protein
MRLPILVSKKRLNIVDCLLHINPPCGVIRTTADYLLLPYSTIFADKRAYFYKNVYSFGIFGLLSSCATQPQSFVFCIVISGICPRIKQ